MFDETTHDAKGIPYAFGNRHTRRGMASGARKRTKHTKRAIAQITGKLEDPKGRGSYKLSRELWEKGKSKFLTPRLIAEKKHSLAELY